jgi:hypothetical protein
LIIIFGFCLPNAFGQTAPQLAAFDACEDSSKSYSKLAMIIAAQVRKISQLGDGDAKADALKQVMGEVNRVKDNEYVILDKLKDDARGEGVRSRIYADTYALVYMTSFEYAVALALSNPNQSEIRFKVDIERNCKKSFR